MTALRTRKQMVDFNTVRKLAGELGDVEESATRGVPALKLGGKLMAWVPVHKSTEPDSLAVRIDPDQHAELIAAAPGVYSLTDHYFEYSTLLVRLSRIGPDALEDLLRMACAPS
jgi:hypothetical protein